MKSVELRTCGTGASDVVRLRAGENIVDFAASDALAPESVVLRAPGVAAVSPAARVALETHAPSAATFRPTSESEARGWNQTLHRGVVTTQEGEQQTCVARG